MTPYDLAQFHGHAVVAQFLAASMRRAGTRVAVGPDGELEAGAVTPGAHTPPQPYGVHGDQDESGRSRSRATALVEIGETGPDVAPQAPAAAMASPQRSVGRAGSKGKSAAARSPRSAPPAPAPVSAQPADTRPVGFGSPAPWGLNQPGGALQDGSPSSPKSPPAAPLGVSAIGAAAAAALAAPGSPGYESGTAPGSPEALASPPAVPAVPKLFLPFGGGEVPRTQRVRPKASGLTPRTGAGYSSSDDDDLPTPRRR